jgi:hypothetical protein
MPGKKRFWNAVPASVLLRKNLWNGVSACPVTNIPLLLLILDLGTKRR